MAILFIDHIVDKTYWIEINGKRYDPGNQVVTCDMTYTANQFAAKTVEEAIKNLYKYTMNLFTICISQPINTCITIELFEAGEPIDIKMYAKYLDKETNILTDGILEWHFTGEISLEQGC